MRRNPIGTSVMLAGILLLPWLIAVAQETTSLFIEAPQGQTRVIQVQGKNYVEVDEVARITGGSLRFAGNQIILTLPESDTPAQATESAPQPAASLSKPFLTGGIETMREILEWHAALKNAIEQGNPLSDTCFGNYRRQVQSSLAQTPAQASTHPDQKAFPLPTHQLHTTNDSTH